MPTLDWTGKQDAIHAAEKVPYRLLERDSALSCGDMNSGNLIVQADNSDALTALLPFYRGRVKCIYIDPPYNTGSSSSRYNNNFPHSTWLSLMYPRLEMLKQFLTEDGAIFISIDDNEQAHLKIICDEIFGASNFVAQFNWRRRSGANDALNNVSLDHEYIICYAKQLNSFSLNGVKKTFDNYSNPDNDPRGEWTRGDLTCGKTAAQRPNLFYPITDPATGITYECNPDHVWRFERSRMQNLIAEGKVLFPPNGRGRPAYKRHRSELRSETKPFSSIIDTPTETDLFFLSFLALLQASTFSSIINTPLNSTATRELRGIFGAQVFDYPKTVNLIQQIVEQATDKDSLVLDAYAGSGTTAHAVLNLNASDGGNRKFILIEREDFCKTITAERVRRVGGAFDYYRLGEPLFTATGALNPAVTFEALAAYIWFKFTQTPYSPPEKFSPLIGIHKGTAYYLIRGELTRQIFETLPAHDGAKIIFGDTCRMSATALQMCGATFRQLPTAIR